MALEIRPWQESAHSCPLPWPKDPDVPEGHVCECGKRWVFQPARWDPLYTLEELRRRQEAGDFLRGIIPNFPAEPHQPGPEGAVIVPIPRARDTGPEMPVHPAS